MPADKTELKDDLAKHEKPVKSLEQANRELRLRLEEASAERIVERLHQLDASNT